MNIPSNVFNQIHDYVVNKNLDESVKPIPHSGKYEINYKYIVMSNDKYPDVIFVVYNSMKYHNKSLVNEVRSALPFNKDNGSFIGDFDKNNYYNGFFSDCIKIKELL